MSDLREVRVKYLRGIPWAVFQVDQHDGSANFYTVLRPTMHYLWTRELSNLSVLDSKVIKYVDFFGREH
jgi:hypothetical protein